MIYFELCVSGGMVGNRDDLDREIEDVLAVVQEMRINGDIDPRRPSTEDLFDRWESKERWTHHQGAEVAE